MTRADRTLLVVLVLSALLAVPVAAWASRDTGAVRLSGPSGESVIDAGRDGTYTVTGHMSEVVFEVRDGTVRCVDSGCPDQLCVNTGSVRSGAPVVCAPNGVIAQYTGAAGVGGLDAVSR